MESLWKEIDEYVVQNKMMLEGSVIMAAVSGGVDSMCMLHYLLDRKEKNHFKLAVFHFNHHLREEAGEDEAFVRAFAQERNIPIFVGEGDVKKEATDKGLTIEEAARQMRYNAMFDSAKQFAKELTCEEGTIPNLVLAFAHNAGDQAETVLFRLFRGTGIKGLRGIAPVSYQNGFSIIRPLLGSTREKIEYHMKKSQNSWVEDRTNQGDDYSRNKIRHNIVDYAVKTLNRRTIENICRAATEVSEGYEYIKKQTQEAIVSCIKVCDGEEFLDIQELKAYDIYLQKQIVLAFLEKKTVSRKDVTAEHIEAILALLHSKKNGKLDLPYGLKAEKEYNNLFLRSESAINTYQHKENEKAVNEKNTDSDYLLEQQVFDYNVDMDIPTATYTKWVDYDKIQNRVEIRTRQQGDYLYIDASGNKTSLKKYFINEKIPQKLRDKVLLVTDGSHVLWVVGYRISAGVKVTRETKRILQLRYCGDIN